MNLQIVAALVVLSLLGFTHYQAYKRGVHDEHNRVVAEAEKKRAAVATAAAATESESAADRARARAVQASLTDYISDPASGADCFDDVGLQLWASSADRMSGGVSGGTAGKVAGAGKQK